MDEARRRIAAALAVGPGAPSALGVLGAALEWAAAELRALEGTADAATAFETLLVLDDALDGVEPFLSALPSLSAAARSGEDVVGHLAARTRRFGEVAGQVAEDRARLEELSLVEEQLRLRLAEHEELRQRLEELRRLERQAAELDAWQEQRDSLDTRLAVLRERDTRVDDALTAGGEELLRLTDEQLALLAPRTRLALERADVAQRALSEEQRRLQGYDAEYAEVSDRLQRVKAELGSRLEGLRLQAGADRELACALARFGGPGGAEERVELQQAEAVVQGIEQRVAEVEDVLRRVLLDRDSPTAVGREVFNRVPGG